MLEYAALVVSPRALPERLILVFQHPVGFNGLGKRFNAAPGRQSAPVLHFKNTGRVLPVRTYFSFSFS
jgi:hypothetical protein